MAGKGGKMRPTALSHGPFPTAKAFFTSLLLSDRSPGKISFEIMFNHSSLYQSSEGAEIFP